MPLPSKSFFLFSSAAKNWIYETFSSRKKPLLKAFSSAAKDHFFLVLLENQFPFNTVNLFFEDLDNEPNFHKMNLLIYKAQKYGR